MLLNNNHWNEKRNENSGCTLIATVVNNAG